MHVTPEECRKLSITASFILKNNPEEVKYKAKGVNLYRQKLQIMFLYLRHY